MLCVVTTEAAPISEGTQCKGRVGYVVNGFMTGPWAALSERTIYFLILASSTS